MDGLKGLPVCDTRKWPVKFRDFRETGPWPVKGLQNVPLPPDVSKNKPDADESAFPWNSLEKRYVTAIKRE